jgi:hypothetical protein
MSMERLHRVIDEEIRVASIPTPILIHETIDRGLVAGQPYIWELICRLDPDWKTRYGPDGEPTPESGLPPFTKDGK